MGTVRKGGVEGGSRWRRAMGTVRRVVVSQDLVVAMCWTISVRAHADTVPFSNVTELN